LQDIIEKSKSARQALEQIGKKEKANEQLSNRGRL
jgi:hypothetical protein